MQAPADEGHATRARRPIKPALKPPRQELIKFYFHQRPNPLKVGLFLEEAQLPYEVVPIDLLKGDQHKPEFRTINPNGKLPDC